MNRLTPVFLFSILVTASESHGQTLQSSDSALQWAETITAESLADHLYILAADSMEGRETGKEGQRKAAAYLADQFESMGLDPVNGSYFQDVPLKVSSLLGGVLSFGDEKLTFKNDFVPYPGIEIQELSAEAVFVGFGIQEGKWDDYAGVDVRGKVVVLLSGEPGNGEKGFEVSGTNEESRWSKDPSMKRNLADSLGASAVVVVSSGLLFDKKNDNCPKRVHEIPFQIIFSRVFRHFNRPMTSMVFFK